MTGTPDEFDWDLVWPEGTNTKEWSHAGIAVLADDTVVFGAPGGAGIVLVSASGGATVVGVPLLEVHGVTVDSTGGQETLWLADPGFKARPEHDYAEERRSGQVVRIAPDGEVLDRLEQPDLPVYSDAPWRPTSVAVDDESVWVADGYGASLVQRFDRSGRLLATLDGSSTGIRFDCPHGLVVDSRGADAYVVVADRGNSRLVLLDHTGSWRGVLTDPLLRLPSCLALSGDDLVVTDLGGDLLAIDRDGRVRSLVDPDSYGDAAAPWPNRMEDGRLVRPHLRNGSLHAPHGVAIAGGTIFLTEWLIGGRQLRLRQRGVAAEVASQPTAENELSPHSVRQK